VHLTAMTRRTEPSTLLPLDLLSDLSVG